MTVSIDEFLALDGPIFDVRSPKEFEQAHIPGAISLPLFTDEERAIVGTVYKREGQQKAIHLGVKLVGPKLFSMLEKAHDVFSGSSARIYCWRGGMRSGFIRFFLDLLLVGEY